MSKVNKHLNKYFKRKKEFIRLDKERRENNHLIRNQGYYKLEKPIPHGWYETFVLRDDISRREDADFYQEILDVCNSSIWSLDGKFIFRDDKKRKHRKKPVLKVINLNQYSKLSDKVKEFFKDVTFEYSRYWRIGYTDRYYRCTLTYEIVTKISRSYITHRREHNSDLYSTGNDIDKKLFYLTKGNEWSYLKGRQKNGYEIEEEKQEFNKEKKQFRKDILIDFPIENNKLKI